MNVQDRFGEFQDKYFFKLEIKSDTGSEDIEKYFTISSYSDHLKDPYMLFYDIHDGNMEEDDWESLEILSKLNKAIEADSIGEFVDECLNYWSYGSHVIHIEK